MLRASNLHHLSSRRPCTSAAVHKTRRCRAADHHMPEHSPAKLCVTCGTQYAPGSCPRALCTICDEERQYVGHDGQEWTTRAELQQTGHQNSWTEVEPGVAAIGLQPKVGIGQRAYFIQTGQLQVQVLTKLSDGAFERPYSAFILRTSEHGNFLWDLVSFLDQGTQQKIRSLGGLSGIAISHPHYYCNMADWAEVFGCPVHLPASDKEWVMQPSERIRCWEGEQLELCPGLTVLRIGGHFAGSSVLAWQPGSEGRGSLFTGDTVQIVQDRRYLSFMWSYPNYIPLPAEQVKRMQETLKPWNFDNLHGAFTSITDGAAAVQRSADRYIGILDGSLKRRYF